MKITFAGHESKGAWVLRAKQIAPYLNARLDPNFTNNKCDLLILVKKPEPPILKKIVKSKVPIIWDIQDSWPQTLTNNLSQSSREDFLNYYSDLLDKIKPKIIISATSQMKKDMEELGYRSVIINHHCRKDINLNPIRNELNIVGIEGNPKQFGNWIDRMTNICNKINLTFKYNLDTTKDKLHLFDLVVNIRAHNGYGAKYWKSNIKLANAHGSGTPAICSREQGYLDNACGYERWADTEEEIIAAIEELRPYEVRKEIHEQFLRYKISIEDVVKEYQNLIDSIK